MIKLLLTVLVGAFLGGALETTIILYAVGWR